MIRNDVYHSHCRKPSLEHDMIEHTTIFRDNFTQKRESHLPTAECATTSRPYIRDEASETLARGLIRWTRSRHLGSLGLWNVIALTSQLPYHFNRRLSDRSIATTTLSCHVIKLRWNSIELTQDNYTPSHRVNETATFQWLKHNRPFDHGARVHYGWIIEGMRARTPHVCVYMC